MHIGDHYETGLDSEKVFEKSYQDHSGSLEHVELWRRTDDSYFVEARGGYDGYIKRDFGTEKAARTYIVELEEHNK